MHSRAWSRIGLATLVLFIAIAGAVAHGGARPAGQPVPTRAAISSSVAPETAPIAPPHSDASFVLAPRPRLQTPLTAALRQASYTSPPGNFPFQTATSSDHLVTLHYYYRSAENASGILAEITSILHDMLQPRLGLALKRNVDIWVYNSRGEFLAGTNPDSPQITGAFTTLDGAGVYTPFVPGMDSVSLFAHELTHVLVIQNSDLGQLTFRLFPVWMEEGLAESSVPDDGLDAAYDDATLRRALYNGGFLDIFTVFSTRYPQDPDTDNLCYAEARAFLKYMSTTYGPASFQGFVHDILDGELDYASLNNFGVDLQTLKGQWLTSLGFAAPAHAAAVFPALATPQPFTPGKLGGVATQTRPFAVEGGENLLFSALTKLAALLAALIFLVASIEFWLRDVRRRRAHRAALAESLLIAAPVADVPSAGGVASTKTLAEAPLAAAENDAVPLITPRAVPLPSEDVAPPAPVAAAPGAPERTSSLVALDGAPTPNARWLDGASAWELAVFALLLPLIFGAGVLESRLDATQLWRHAYLAAGIAALVGVIGVGALLIGALRARHNVGAHVVVLLALLAAAGWAYSDGQAAGITQGRLFDDRGAYTLAYSTLRDASAPRSDLHRVQVELAEFAEHTGDYAAAIQHYHLAVANAPSRAASETDRLAILRVTQEWGKSLVDAHEFDQALAVYRAELSSGDCDAECVSALGNASGAASIGWAQDLIRAKRLDDASATLQALVRSFPDTKAAGSAKAALDAAGNGLAPALAARKSGDTVAMNLILERIAYGQPDTVDAAIATAFAQPVSGQIDTFYLYGQTTHAMLIAFRTETQAAAFIRNHTTDYSVYDTIVFKVATVADAKGQFLAYAPAGYVYVPVWETKSQDGRPGWHYNSWKSFAVEAFTPLTVTAIRP